MLKLSFALLILCGLSRALVCIPTSGPVGMEAMYAEWGAAMRTVAATAVSGVIESPGTDVFTLAAACGDDDWFSCPIGPAGPVTLQGVAGDAVACTAYVHPLCSADVNTDVATVGARGRYTWTAVPTATVVPGGTHGGVPQAYVAASVKYALTRSNSTAADATLEGIRIGCSAPAGHACFVTIDLPGLALDAEIAAGATASLPPVRFVVPAAAIGTELAIVPRASCRNGAAAYPAGPTLAVGLPIARVDPPSGWVASVGSDAWWSDPMFDTGITDEVPVTLGPFDALGVRPAYVPAALSVRSEVLSMAVQLFHAELSRSAPDPILPVTDASFDGTVVVSDVNCVRSAADWAAVAIKTPELLAFIRFPHEIIPGLLTLLSPVRSATRACGLPSNTTRAPAPGSTTSASSRCSARSQSTTTDTLACHPAPG